MSWDTMIAYEAGLTRDYQKWADKKVSYWNDPRRVKYRLWAYMKTMKYKDGSPVLRPSSSQ